MLYKLSGDSLVTGVHLPYSGSIGPKAFKRYNLEGEENLIYTLITYSCHK